MFKKLFDNPYGWFGFSSLYLTVCILIQGKVALGKWGFREIYTRDNQPFEYWAVIIFLVVITIICFYPAFMEKK